jgi:multidrug transporter EmrE-like cation transporter
MIYVFLSVVLNAFAQLGMKMASQKDLSFKGLFGNVPLYFAGSLYLISIFFWLKGLQGMPLSRAYPFQSLGYVIVFGLSYLLLSEKFSGLQIIGLLIICLGIAVLGFSK